MWTEQRTKLLERLETMIGRESALSKHFRGQDGRLESDFGDRANFTGQDEVLEGLEAAALSEIAQIRGALERIDQGTYGECDACGEPIGEARLHAIPFTRLCVDCATQAEA